MDKYIDYNEVSEYGGNFVTNAPKLAGLSDLVNVEKLVALVSSKVDAVTSELQKTRQDRSDLRGERGETTESDEAVRDVITRFYYHLRSLPQTINFDLEAFFPGGSMGELSGLKPADLKEKATDVLRGFETSKNKLVNGFAPWKTEMSTATEKLANALGSKSHATGNSFVATASLIDARKDFLQAYNKVAKPIIRGLLSSLDRENEMPLFFKDLAVNEDSKTPKPTTAPTSPPTTPPTPPKENG